MRTVRLLAGGLLLILIALGVVLWYAAQHQTELVRLALSRISQRTGLHFAIGGSRLGLGTHLVVLLEHPRVSLGHQQIASLDQIRAVFSYRSLLHGDGLPLYGLVLERGSIRVLPPAGLPNPSSIGFSAIADAVDRNLDRLSAISNTFGLTDITLLDQSGKPLAENLHATAHPEHRQAGHLPWLVRFGLELPQPLVAGTRITGNFQLGRGSLVHTLARGRLWFWDLALNNFAFADLSASAHLSGGLRLTVSSDGQLSGKFDLGARELALGGNALRAPMALGNYWFRGTYSISQKVAELKNFELRHQDATIFDAEAALARPYESNRALTFSISRIDFALANAAAWLRSFRAVPDRLVDLAGRFKSGNLKLNQIALLKAEPVRQLSWATLRRLTISATLARARYLPPPSLRLPPVYWLDGELTYSDGTARVEQGSGQIGDSSLSDLSLTADLRRAPARIPYQLKLRSWLAIGELYHATSRVIYQADPALRGHLRWIYGHTMVRLRAADILRRFKPAVPRDYLVSAETDNLQLKLDELPTPIALSGGNITLRPGHLVLHHTVLVPLDETGSVILNGTIEPTPTIPRFQDFVVEVHQLESGKWLPLVVDPEQLALTGPLGGQLVAESAGAKDTLPAVRGKLTLGRGTIQLGFLRSPIMVTHAATLALDGQGLSADIPASRLEGEPLDLRMMVSDLKRPVLRIDASVARLNFMVMRFIRLPWSPKTPEHFFALPVVGHIAARTGIFDQLAMTGVSADFNHNSRSWRVYNFDGKIFNGSFALELSGRANDNWINISGGLAQVDIGPLFLLAGDMQQAPVVGKLTAQADLWADTDTDFFHTLAGTVSVNIKDGTLNRFTLLRRILGLINLKNWLTAEVPDPRKSGVPFKTINADFRGVRGDFYTHNLRLDGPVMEIAARGELDLASRRMNLEIAMIPFQTFNWIINKIPLIGRNLAGGSKGLVAAYFEVKGPFDNPSIWPKPITSVAEFVLRTLSLPINIIAPNTVR